MRLLRRMTGRKIMIFYLRLVSQREIEAIIDKIFSKPN